MLFNSLSFIILVVITLIIYYLPKFERFQIPTLVVSSFVFYAYHNPTLLVLLLSSITINILASYYVYHGPQKYEKAIATTGVVLNIAILAFFKYSPLIGRTFLTPSNDLFHFLVSIPLPIGISFFTFQGISLMIDTFRHKNEMGISHLYSNNLKEHALNILLYKSFFPQLIAGPIVKAHDFIPQIKRKYFYDIKWDLAFGSLVTGYFLKMVIADNLKDYTFYIQYPYFLEYSSLTLLAMLFGYSIQIFADFAGYSLIAIGTSYLFGYNIMQNFNFPYISKSFSEFWTRWHISLSTFLKEYLYIPLGGNRKGKYRTYLNLFTVMTLGGLWHGAAWSYAIWGMYHGTLLMIEKALGKTIRITHTKTGRVAKILLMFFMVSMGWLLFKLPNFNDVILFCTTLFKNRFFDGQMRDLLYIFMYSIDII